MWYYKGLFCYVMRLSYLLFEPLHNEINVVFPWEYKGVPKLTQDLNLIENTVFSLEYVIFLLNYKVHRIGLFVE